ncbi:glycosyltransferase [Macellibacteroides fermentans]|uniref:glycosyltransferase n=1 Tax=Macellibacteroides fermentans TaxID=879969 RepID=UPI00406D025A
MYIIYVGSFRLPNKDAAASRVLNNAKAMYSQGHSVKFLSWGGEYRESDLCEDGKFRLNGMEYVITKELDVKESLLMRLKSMLHRGDESIRLIKEESIKPDLIILYNADKSWTERMLEYCNKNNIKLANDITEWYANNELHLWDIVPYYINMTKTQQKVQNKILISSYLSNYYAGTNNILLPPLCDLRDEKWSKTVINEKIPSFDGVTLFYAGNPAKKDCVHITINVINSLALKGHAIRFIILGCTRENYMQEHSSMLKSNVLHKNIIFLGRVSQDLIPAYYKYADFMVLLRVPNRKNMAGFPTKFAESISAGIPIIANMTSDLDNYIIDGNTGFRVLEPTDESLNDIIINKVLCLSKKQIEDMKKKTKAIKSSFEYKTYTYSINSFLSNLK